MPNSHNPHSAINRKIIIRGDLKPDIDIDLLVEALLLIADSVQRQQEAEDFVRSLAEPEELAA